MVSDSIPNAAIAIASSNPRDFVKKKRANRSAKLKQCKLDARREQWLSQVKNKGDVCKEEVSGAGATCVGQPELQNERGVPIENLSIRPSVEVDFYEDVPSMHPDSDSESLPANSPTSHTSSILGSNESGVRFSGNSSSSSGRSISGRSSNGSYSGVMSEEEEGVAGDDGCLDDWEAIADALAATEDIKQEHSLNSRARSPHLENNGDSSPYGSQSSVTDQLLSQSEISHGREESRGNSIRRSLSHCHAWKADDAFRPQSLPNLSKSCSLPEHHFDREGSVWGHKTVLPDPTSCPICYEDLDCTDSSFLPCLCGFRLCLFCHKRILEEDARCPGCRKLYDGNIVQGEAILDGGSLSLTVGLGRCNSMITRS